MGEFYFPDFGGGLNETTCVSVCLHLYFLSFFLSLFLYDCAHDLQKFLGQGLNPSHSGNNPRPLTS